MSARARVRVEGREPATPERGPRPPARRRRHPQAPPPVERALRDPGQPLDPAIRSSMQAALGHRLDAVRIHTGPEAAHAAATLDAQALTIGQDILFAAGRYRPDTPTGRQLLAHELIHALQHGPAATAGVLLAPVAVTPARNDPLERQATAAADLVAAGRRVPPDRVTVAAPQARHRLALAPASAAPAAPVEVPDSPEAVRALADEVARLLAFDPDDLFGRVRRRLARLAPGTRRALLAQLQGRVPGAAQARLAELLAELDPAEPDAAEPAVAPDPAAERVAAGPRAEPSAAAEALEVEAEAPATTEAPEPALAEAEALGAGLGGLAPEALLEPPTEEPEVPAEVPELQQAPEEAAGSEGAPAEEPAEPGRRVAEAAEPAAAAGAVAAAVGVEAPTAVPESEVEAEEPEPEGDEEQTEPEDEAAPPIEAIAPGESAPPPEPAPPAEDVPGPVDAANLQAPPSEMPEAAAEPTPPEPEPAGGEEGAALQGEALGAADNEAAAAGIDLAPETEAVGPEGEDAGGDVAPGGGGGGGGGVPIPEPPQPAVPDVAGMEPEEALAAVATLPPAQLQAGLGGVSATSSRSVGAQRTALAADPPSLERPSGSPAAVERAAEELAVPAVPAAPTSVERAPRAPGPPPVRPPALPPQGAPPTDRVRPPDVPGGPKGELSEDGIRVLRSSLRQLPTRDPALEETAGPPPRLVLEGSADPEQARAQRERLEQASQQAQVEGRRDLTEPMGEAALYPEVPPETLRAEVGATTPGPAPAPATGPAAPAAAPGGGPTAGAGPGGDELAASIVAQQERGAELRAATAQARAEMAAQRQRQQATAAEAQARSQEEVTELVRGSAEAQTAERRGARSEVYERRREWSTEQRTLVEGAGGEADAESRRGAEEITDRQQTADREATTHVEQGNQEAAAARREGEQRAERERERGERETSSGGVLGWFARQARAFFDAIKRGIQAAFEWARARVRDAIQAAQRLAAAAIDRARQAIVAAIRRVGDALVAIGDRLLAGFPNLRDRFRRAIRERVERAVARVNQLADALKAGVQKALNFLGAALDAALGLLERGLLAAVDAYGRVVQGAIQFARSVVQALATFAALVRDVAADPIQWLRNLGAAVVDGIRNHLWRALKLAVRQWFDQKLEEVLGLGLTIWNLLRRGGISLAAIGRMVWAGLKQVIPVTLIQLLVEKLVAMIVPAAGAIMVIIEGLRAAWGTVSRILQAFERFFAFLRAVRSGRAGPQFADAVAAAAVAVIDFVANWLLMRVRRPAGAIAGRIRAIALRIGQRLRGLAQLARRGLRRVGVGVRRPSRRGAGRPSRAERERRAREQRRRRAQATLDRAARELGPRVVSLVQRGASRLRLAAQLRWWRRSYSLRELAAPQDATGRVKVVARANPTIELLRNAVLATRTLLHERIRAVWPLALAHPRIRQRLQARQEQRASTFKPAEPGRDPRARVDEPAGTSASAALDVAMGSPVGPGGSPRPPRTREQTVYGGQGAAPLVVREQQQLHRGPGPVLVTVQPHDYPGIAQSIGADPGTAAQIAQSMLQLQRTGAMGSGAVGGWSPQNVAALARLLLHVEAGRDPGAFVTMPMLVQLMARGGLSADEALIGLNQMSPTKAMKISRAAGRELDLQAQGKPSRMRSPQRIAEVNTFLEREREVVLRWLETRIAADPYVFQDTERFERFLRNEIVEYLLDHTLRETFLETSGPPP